MFHELVRKVLLSSRLTDKETDVQRLNELTKVVQLEVVEMRLELRYGQGHGQSLQTCAGASCRSLTDSSHSESTDPTHSCHQYLGMKTQGTPLGLIAGLFSSGPSPALGHIASLRDLAPRPLTFPLCCLAKGAPTQLPHS